MSVTSSDNSGIDIANVPTWQVGIVQSHALRTTKKIADNFLKPYGLTRMHWYIVGAIADTGNDGIRITDLAKQLGTTVGYLTTAVNNLETQGKVLRSGHKHDNRTKILKVSPDYIATCTEIEQGLSKQFRETVFKRMNARELATYVNVLYKLTQLSQPAKKEKA
ncbi:MAG: Transcriptional regulator, MarR family [Candidatus Saccharibacteria bacterium]|nr:Transcriptional regulator, MarR family [Candidatus Saccharibacteria bacterium]